MEKDTPIMFVVNPFAGHWRVRQEWPELLQKFKQFFTDVRYELTSSCDDFREIVEKAHESGAKILVPVGGDGTVHWTINAIVNAGLLDELSVYPFQVGTGGDWSRSLGLPSGYEARFRGLQNLSLHRVDLIEVQLDQEVRYVANVGSVGLGGDVVAEVQNYEKRPPWVYLAAVIHSLKSSNPATVSVELDGEGWFTGAVLAAVVANGPIFGRGIPIAPQARMDDALMDVVLIRHMPFAKALVSLPLLYAKQHLKLKEVSSERTKAVTIAGVGGATMKMELDGEYVESTRADFSIVPLALQVWLPGGPR
jgi:diacylglycerol kinase (ATP)